MGDAPASYRNGMPISITIEIEILVQPPFQFARGRMKQSRLRATLTDPHLWIPLVVLTFGIGLLAALA